MGWFFTKATLLTFRGAYAVLPYVSSGGYWALWVADSCPDDRWPRLGRNYTGTVDHGGSLCRIRWWLPAPNARCAIPFPCRRSRGDPRHLIHIPTVVHVHPDGPVVESTHNDVKFTAPPTGVTAAVVGEILNLALFFGKRTANASCGTVRRRNLGGHAFHAVASLLLPFFERKVVGQKTEIAELSGQRRCVFPSPKSSQITGSRESRFEKYTRAILGVYNLAVDRT